MAPRTAMRHIASLVASRLQAGEALGPALRSVGAPAHVTALVAAGERVGRTGDALREAGELVRRLEILRAATRRALVYPAVVLVVGVLILTIVAVAVAPAMERTFADLGGELPIATIVVLRVSGAMRTGWAAVVAMVAALLVWALRRWLPAGLRTAAFTWLTATLPIVGRIQRDLELAVLARMLATMLAAGVPMLAALRTAGDATPIGHVGAHIRAAADAVERGGGAHGDAGLAMLLDPVEQEILQVGSETGLLVEQWRRVADRRADALEARIHRVGVVIEPLLVVLVGATVGGAVMALYLPMFRILDLL